METYRDLFLCDKESVSEFFNHRTGEGWVHAVRFVKPFPDPNFPDCRWPSLYIDETNGVVTAVSDLDIDTGIFCTVSIAAWKNPDLYRRIWQYIPATKLQRAWKRCISDPNYQMCKNRLLREAKEL